MLFVMMRFCHQTISFLKNHLKALTFPDRTLNAQTSSPDQPYCALNLKSMVFASPSPTLIF